MKNIIKQHREKILWGVFISIVVIGVAVIIGGFWALSSAKDPSLNFVKISLRVALLLAVALLLLHAAWTLTYFRGFAFILLCWLTGFLFEVIGVNYGVVFGGHYVYPSNDELMFFGVPWLIPLYWAAFIYAGYNIVSSFLFWINKDKPNKHRHNAMLLPLLVFLDGLVVVAIDLFMEPLQVMVGSWTWLERGPYYSIPIGNFIGWFTVTVIATGVFRVFEYLSPREPTTMDKSIFLIPVIGYGMLCLMFLSFALKMYLPQLALIGFLVMFPIVIVNLILFINWKKDLRKNN